MVSVDRSTAFAGTVALAEGRGGREMPGTASPGWFSGTSLPGVVSPASGFASVLPALPSKKAFSSHGVSSSKPCQNAFSRSRLAHSALRAASSGDSAATGGVSGATGCSWAVFTQERSRKSRSTPSRMPRSRAPKRPALLRRMMAFPAVAPAIPAAVPAAVPVAPAVLVPAEGPAARPAPGTALRAAVPGNRCGGSSRCSRCRSSHTGGRFPVFRLAPEYRGRGFVRALREQAPVDEHGMAVDDEDIVRRRDEQRLAEQDAAGRVVEMGGDGFPRPAQGSPRLFGFSRVEAGEGGADAFQRRIPGNGGVAAGVACPVTGSAHRVPNRPRPIFFR